MTGLQWANLWNFIQKETPKYIVKEIRTFGNASLSNHNIHVIFACSCTIRAVSNLHKSKYMSHIIQYMIYDKWDIRAWGILNIETTYRSNKTFGIEPLIHLQTSSNIGWKELSNMTSTPYIALDVGLCISGWATAAASNTDRIIFLTLVCISNHLTARGTGTRICIRN